MSVCVRYNTMRWLGEFMVTCIGPTTAGTAPVYADVATCLSQLQGSTSFMALRVQCRCLCANCVAVVAVSCNGFAPECCSSDDNRDDDDGDNAAALPIVSLLMHCRSWLRRC